MSVALFIVLERHIAGFDPGVSGKALGRARAQLDALAEVAGVKPLMEFYSASPEVLFKFAQSEGVAIEENEGPIPPERWFLAEDGLVTIRGLKDAAKAEKIENLGRILADLDEIERVLETAKENGVRWHLVVDF